MVGPEVGQPKYQRRDKIKNEEEFLHTTALK
jgi:hypothetical protein